MSFTITLLSSGRGRSQATRTSTARKSMSSLARDQPKILFGSTQTYNSYTYQYVSIFILLQCYDFAVWNGFMCNAASIRASDWVTGCLADWMRCRKCGDTSKQYILLRSARICSTITARPLAITCLGWNSFPIQIHFARAACRRSAHIKSYLWHFRIVSVPGLWHRKNELPTKRKSPKHE